MKKIISSILVVMMIVAFAAPAFAADTPVSSNNGTAPLELVGQVSDTAIIVSVTIPTQIAFAVETLNKKFVAVTSGTGTITNNGPTAVDITLTSVTDADTLLGKVNLKLGGIGLIVGPSQSLLLKTVNTGATADLAVTGSMFAGDPDIEPAAYSIQTILKVTAA